jgi:hypothetical protein
MSADVWAVEVRYHDDDPATYGPYTKLQAERVAKALLAEALLARDVHGCYHHPWGVESAMAVPQRRYTFFLTGAERRRARSAARRAVAAP